MKSRCAPTTDQGRIDALVRAVEEAVHAFYEGFDEDGPDDDEVPGWLVNAEQTLRDVA